MAQLIDMEKAAFDGPESNQGTDLPDHFAAGISLHEPPKEHNVSAVTWIGWGMESMDSLQQFEVLELSFNTYCKY